MYDVAVDPVPRQVHLGLHRAPVAEHEHAGDRRQSVQVDAAAHPRAEGAGEVQHPRRAGQIVGAAGLHESKRDPQAQVFGAAAPVGARFQAAQQQPGAGDRDGHPAERGDEEDERQRHPPPGQRRRQSTSNHASTFPVIASHVTHCSPVSVMSGTVTAIWAA